MKKKKMNKKKSLAGFRGGKNSVLRLRDRALEACDENANRHGRRDRCRTREDQKRNEESQVACLPLHVSKATTFLLRNEG